MKVLFALHQFFPNRYTGTERLVLNLSKQMQRMGHSVQVLTYGINETEGFSKKGDLLFKEYVFQGVPVYTIRHQTVPLDIDFEIFDPIVETWLTDFILKGGFDILHVCHPMRVGSVIKVARQMNIPVILTLTDFWPMCPKQIAVTERGELCTTNGEGVKCVTDCFGETWGKKLKERAQETTQMFKMVDTVVSATDFLRKIFLSNEYVANIRLVRFGTDYQHVRRNSKVYASNSEITIGFMSTLLPHKGAHILLDAWNQTRGGNIRLKIFGDYHNNIEYFEAIQEKAGDSPKIEILGRYDYEAIPEILDNLDLVAVPSVWWENSPLILLQSIAHNVPAIVSDLGGMTEVIEDGRNGFSFEAGSAASLAELLQRLSDDPTILNQIKAGIQRPPRIEEEAFQYERLYAEAIGDVRQND